MAGPGHWGPGRGVELTGTPGSSVARDRAAGFRQGFSGHPGVRVVASQTGSFSRSAGQAVLANVLQAVGRGATAVFAHNDEMALGAVQAIRAVGRVPGGDVLVVSIDGQRTALEAVARGEIGCTVEFSPRLGPAAFAVLEDLLAGRPVPPRIVLPDRLFDRTNAAAAAPESY